MFSKILTWLENTILSDGNKRKYTEDGKYWISGNGFGVNTEHPEFLENMAKTIGKFDKSFNKGRVMSKYEMANERVGLGKVEFLKIKEFNTIHKSEYHKGGNMQQTTLDTHFNNFTQWSTDRKIIQNGDILAQGLKLVSEVGELADNLAKGRCVKDDIGDCCVVLNNLVHMQGLTLDECLEQAWSDIKNRTGSMNEHGVFIKDDDVEK